MKAMERRMEKCRVGESAQEEKMTGIMADCLSDSPARQQKARDDLIDCLGGFIVMMMKRYCRHLMENYFNDMFNECVVSILGAMKNYRPSESAPTTYFTCDVYFTLKNFEHRTFLGSAQRRHRYINPVREARDYYCSLRGGHYMPTMEEIMRYTRLSESDCLKGLKQLQIAEAVGCDSCNVADENNYWTPVVPSAEDIVIEDETKTELQKAVHSAMERLSGFERDIICRYYGIGCEKSTLKDISACWDMSCAKIRKARKQAEGIIACSPEIRAIVGQKKFGEYIGRKLEEARKRCGKK